MLSINHSLSSLGLAQPEACSLTHLRTRAQAAPTWPCYSVVLVHGNNVAQSPSVPARTSLYLGGPGQLNEVLAQIPTHAQGQALCFADAFLYTIGDSSELLLSLFHDASASEPLPLADEPAAEVAFLLTSMQQAAGEPLLREPLLRAYLHTLLLRCTSLRRQHYPAAHSPGRPGLFLRFRQLLEQYYTQWKSVAAYADQLCVTPNHLSVSIRRETGRPASDHIRQRIMQEAQRLVAAHDAPLKEIAYQLGFEDVAHFSKLFKRCHGISFSSFKAQTRQQYAAPEAA